jgi:hypothetical protein
VLPFVFVLVLVWLNEAVGVFVGVVRFCFQLLVCWGKIYSVSVDGRGVVAEFRGQQVRTQASNGVTCNPTSRLLDRT